MTAVEVTMRRATLDAIPIAPLLAAPLTIRDAVAEDAAPLATLLGRAYEGEIWDVGAVDRELLSDATVKRTLVVCAGARLLATASFQVREDTPGSAWVRWVGTDPERRREGFARTLVIAVLGLAARAGCRDVWLGTRTDRLAAIRLYLELGFEPLGVNDLERGAWEGVMAVLRRDGRQSKAREDLVGIQAAAERSLRALDNLDWEPFRASWASEPTVFFPFGDTPDRVTGQVKVEARWRRFFEEMRLRNPGPPYLNLKPLDIRTERYGDVGLVTFTLELTIDRRHLPLQRRTLILVREHDAWKLAHMHASGASQP